MAVNKRLAIRLVLVFFGVFFLIHGLKSTFADKEALTRTFTKQEMISSLTKTFVRMEAETLGKRTIVYFNEETQAELNDFAQSILRAIAGHEEKKLLHIADTDLHRMLCFFVTRYVYAVEAHQLPDALQVYLVPEQVQDIDRDAMMTLEVGNVQNIFERCENLELKLQRNGLVYFPWDFENYLNTVLVELVTSEIKPKEQSIPEMYKRDPLLLNLYQTALTYEKHYGLGEKFIQEVGDETVNLLLAGVKEELHLFEGTGKIKLTHSITRCLSMVAKTIGKKYGRKLASQLWKQRQIVGQTLTKDDAALFATQAAQEKTAFYLTNLIAAPASSITKEKNFISKLKNILGSDAKIKFKLGRDKVYVGYALKFK